MGRSTVHVATRTRDMGLIATATAAFFPPRWSVLAIVAVLAALGCGSGSSGSLRGATIGGGAAGSSGGGSTGGGLNPGTNNPPTAWLVDPSGVQKAAVDLVYYVADAESHLADVTVEYSADSGTTWALATYAPQGEPTIGRVTSPAGERHVFVWDARADLGLRNVLAARLRLTPLDAAIGAVTATADFPVIIAGRQDPEADYDTTRGVLALSADVVGGYVPPSVAVNHVTHTKIYGDGKVVFIDTSKGYGEIFEGSLPEEVIVWLFLTLKANGFWGFGSYYRNPISPTDLPSTYVSAKLRNQNEKRVGSYGGALSAPPGFMDCYRALVFPQIQPANVLSYVRQPITQTDLRLGYYYGMEYQKKLDTPTDWSWVDAGRSSKWRKP